MRYLSLLGLAVLALSRAMPQHKPSRRLLTNSSNCGHQREDCLTSVIAELAQVCYPRSIIMPSVFSQFTSRRLAQDFV
jgi:hypothetical protein